MTILTADVLRFSQVTDTHSASAIASTEKEGFPCAHVRVKGFRTQDLNRLSFQMPDLYINVAGKTLKSILKPT